MAVENTPRRAGPFVSNGNTTEYAFSFRVFKADEVGVSVSSSKEEAAIDSPLSYAVDYTVTLNDDQENNPGGTVTLKEAPASGIRVTVLSNVAATQETVLTNHDGMSPKTLNEVHDKITILIQQLEEKADRTVVVPASSTKTPDELLTDILDTAAKANEYAQKSEQIHADVVARHEDIENIQEHVDEQAAKVDGAMDAIMESKNEAITQITGKKNDALLEVDAVKQNAMGAIEGTKISALNNLEAKELSAVSSILRQEKDSVDVIEEEGNRVKAEVNSLKNDLQSVADAVEANKNTVASDKNEVRAAAYEVSANKQEVDTALASVLSAKSEAVQASATAVETVNTASFSFRYYKNASANMNSGKHNLEPNTGVKVGDHVMNADGDVFIIVSTNDTRFTLGGLVTNLRGVKGDQGIQGLRGVTFTPTLEDDGTITWSNDGGLNNPPSINIKGPQGIQGEKGEAGAGLTINGSYESYEALVAAHPIGEPGDAYLIQGDVWYWAEDNDHWLNGGPLQGPQGIQGIQGIQGERGLRGFHFTPSVDSAGNLTWSNDGGLANPASVNIKGPQGIQGIQGERGYHFTPSIDNNGNVSWTNNGGLENPATKNVRGPQGFYFTPSVDSAGNLTWTNNGNLSNPTSRNITGPRGFTFTPAVDGKGNISWTNNGNLTNPATQNIRGYHYTPSVDGKGNLSWTNNGELDNPATQNIRGYHYTPSLDADCNLSWTNTGDLENPPTQNIRGFHFTPSVDDNGNISWTNNGGMTNPATKNIRGPRGFTFTPSVSDKGIISWTNNGDLANPVPIDIKGPCIIRVSGYAYNPVSTKEEWEAILESGVMSLGLVELQNLRPNDFIIWTGLYQGDNILGDPDGLGLIGFQAVATVVSVDLTNLKVYFKDGLFLRGTAGKDGKDGQSYIGLKPTFGTAQTFAEWQSFVNSSQVNFTVYKEDLNHPYVNDIGIIFGTISDRDSVSVAIFVQIKSSSTQANGTLLSITAEPMGWIFSGLQGEKGDPGKDGATFTPTVDSSGNLTWANNGGLSNPATVNIKGPKGDQGIQGPKGDGLNFEDLTSEQIAQIKGPKGDQGERGYYFTPSVNSSGVLSWSNNGGLSNPSSVNIKGPQGKAFTYDDFTQAQLEALRGPKGDTGDSTRIVTVEFATRPSMEYAFAMNYGGETYIGNLPTEYQTRIKEGDLLAVPILISDRDNMQAILFGEFKDFLYAGSVSLGIRILGCLAGAPGATFTPNVDSSGNLSWTNDSGLKNPTTRNIMGPAGKNGTNGKDGADGKTPQVSFRYDSSTGNLYYTVTTA